MLAADEYNAASMKKKNTPSVWVKKEGSRD
jgi:hypothetical protein